MNFRAHYQFSRTCAWAAQTREGLATGSGGFSSNATRIYESATAPFRCPGGTSENSPALECWEDWHAPPPVPKGRLKPQFTTQPSLRDYWVFDDEAPNAEALGYCQESLRDEDEILVALDVSSPPPFGHGCANVQCEGMGRRH